MSDSIYLSDLLRFRVSDARNQQPLVDLAVHLDEQCDYPPVSWLYFSTETGYGRLSWAQVTALDTQRRRIFVEDLKQGLQLPRLESSSSDVLTKEEVLDCVVLDLQNRRATRANDLVLERRADGLVLVGADVSPKAILRRLTRGLLALKGGPIHSWKYLEFLRGDPAAVARGAGYNRRLTRLPAGDLALLSQAVPYLHAAELLTLLPDPLAAETLQALPAIRQVQAFGELSEDQAVRLLDLMAPDLAADLLGRLQRAEAERLLRLLQPEPRRRVVDLLRYPADTVGGIMTNDLAVYSEGLTAEQVKSDLRLRGSRLLYTLFVCDQPAGKLLGTLQLAELLTAEAGATMGELANPYVPALSSHEAAPSACHRVLDSGLPALPVLDEGRLVGAVTYDIAVSQLVPPHLQDHGLRVLA